MNRLAITYFSPTGTTRRVLDAVASGLGPAQVVVYDLTPPEAERGGPVEIAWETLALVGAPVYRGRVAPLAASRLRRLRGRGGPAVPVVVYGNRAYEDALLELRDLVADQGFVPVAAGAFIGEHSYSTAEQPLAPGRPDQDDLATARTFGATLRQRLEAFDPSRPSILSVPGNVLYKETPLGPPIAPVTDPSLCVLCGECVAVCPTGAASLGETAAQTDPAACVLCQACAKACPAGARATVEPRVMQVRQWLYDNFRARRAPETFFPED